MYDWLLVFVLVLWFGVRLCCGFVGSVWWVLVVGGLFAMIVCCCGLLTV